MPASATCFRVAPTAARAELSHGSLSSTGAMNECGYQTLWRASGATNAMFSDRKTWARPRMPLAESPRPWIRIMAASASLSGVPSVAAMPSG